jgi:UDP-2,3-diacylglucosamine pyrophosphatase LpxH
VGHAKTYYRSVWISDAHLCTRDCQVGLLERFLKNIRCDYLYFVGDMVDLWQLKRRWYWPAEVNGLIRRVLKMAKKGTRVYYLPGNHDEALRPYSGLHIGGVEIRDRMVHSTADGRRLLVLHGDAFDAVVQCRKWLAILGTVAYDYLVMINRVVNAVRRWFGRPYWSLAGAIKRKVKQAVSYTQSFEDSLIEAARRERVDGVVCGHIHSPANKSIGPVAYYNCGDWIESCSALVEHADGRMEIVHEAQESNPAASPLSPAAVAAVEFLDVSDDPDDLDWLDPSADEPTPVELPSRAAASVGVPS